MAIFKKAPKPIPDIHLSPDAQSGLGKERLSLSDGSDPDDDVELVDAEEMDTEVEDVILVRKLGSLISLRDRRLKVLKELELVSEAI